MDPEFEQGEFKPSTIEYLPFLKSHQRFHLKLKDSTARGPIYIEATLNPLIPGYQFDLPRDSEFNLSQFLGNDNGSFVWGRAAFERSASDIHLRIDSESSERILAATLNDSSGNPVKAEINLDKHLDIIEYVDENTRELLRKLGEKPPTSRVSGVLSQLECGSYLSIKRQVILCFDGTSNHFSKNVSMIFNPPRLLANIFDYTEHECRQIGGTLEKKRPREADGVLFDGVFEIRIILTLSLALLPGTLAASNHILKMLTEYVRPALAHMHPLG
jgi:hypothetical protein